MSVAQEQSLTAHSSQTKSRNCASLDNITTVCVQGPASLQTPPEAFQSCQTMLISQQAQAGSWLPSATAPHMRLQMIPCPTGLQQVSLHDCTSPALATYQCGCQQCSCPTDVAHAQGQSWDMQWEYLLYHSLAPSTLSCEVLWGLCSRQLIAQPAELHD